MPTTYELAPDTVDALVRRVMKQHHKELADAGVTVTTLMANTGKNKAGDPLPLKLRGYPVAAYIKVTSLKERAKGVGDAEMIVDEQGWEQLTEAQRVALVDHELTHLTLTLDKNDKLKTDDLDRPKMRMRLHDHEVGIFKEVIERHGEDALDYRTSRHFADDMGQLLMWADDKRKVG